MYRSATRLTAALAIALTAAACVDAPTGAPEAALIRSGPSASAIVPGTCTNVQGLINLAAPLFGPNTNPSINSVVSKIRSLDRDVKKNKIADAQVRAYEIVQFTLKKHNQGGLSGSAAQVKAFTDAIFCFAGIDLNPLPDNTYLILPSDQPQVVKNLAGNAGISFQANPVSVPTLIEIQTNTVSTGPWLNTKLDQYRGFVFIRQEPSGPLANSAVVEICADGVIPQSVRDRLRLGHGKLSGFEIAAPVTPIYTNVLVCPNEVAIAAAPAPLWQRLASKLLPQQLHASSAMMFAGGGVGGTVTEFSPFAPVDPELSFGGGVGGTVTEFIRVPAGGLLSANVEVPVDPCASPRAGKQLDASCLPFVTIRTRLGTVMQNVPVSWAVTSGAGSIAPLTGFCGAYASTAATTTDVLGRAGICWTLGNPGTNTATATPSAGGDAPTGVTFTPATQSFSYTAVVGPPTVVEIVSGSGQVGAAGSTLPSPLVAKVTDDMGYPVPGIPVTWQVIHGGGSLSPLGAVSGPNGLAGANWTLGAVGANQAKAYIASVGFFYNYFYATATAP